MTPAQLCTYLQLVHADGRPNINRLYILRSRYGMPAERLGGQLRFRRSVVDQWLAEQKAVQSR